MDNPLKAAIFRAKADTAPRVFETNKKEIGFAKPGDPIELCIIGKIQSIHDDGRIYVKVSSVEMDDSETQNEHKQKKNFDYGKTVKSVAS